MEFPISVVVIEDRIVLCQGQITSDFKKKLNAVEYARFRNDKIGSVTCPQLSTNIYINGSRETENYSFYSVPFSQTRYDSYLDLIEFYKREMGYV